MSKIVIDIDDNLYTRLFDCGAYDAVDMLNVCTAIRKGTPLTKGHGRLLILDEELANKFFASFSFSCQKWISEVGISNATLKVINADRDCQTCENAKDGKCAETEECHECMWDSQYKEVDNG